GACQFGLAAIVSPLWESVVPRYAMAIAIVVSGAVAMTALRTLARTA
ncbi:Bcr/CflA family drug resistance efflux transporter, partial [Rhodococcus hoagii]|nr:Bcr/CflA family drug resistance efflux transporter [Prescottella equi]